MPKTLYRPSIHGWPFGNSYDYRVQIGFLDTTLDNMGYCGGMCWTSIARFFSASRIPRDLQMPAQEDPIYQEIFNAQVASLASVGRIYDWQQRSQISHANRANSQGYLTKQEWPAVKQKLDEGKPVTLTLIAHSNDYNPADLSDNHRVVAYGYDISALSDADWVHGDRHSSINKIAVWIYDPNEEGRDDVHLTFFTGCDDNWIGLRHSTGAQFRAFFPDDENRGFSHATSTRLAIDAAPISAITAYDRAAVDLRFSWEAPIIPYFTIAVDGVNWQFNNGQQQPQPELLYSLQPIGGQVKQCDSRIGSLAIQVLLPRRACTVSVRLLDSPGLDRSIAVDATPMVQCQPYVRTRVAGAGPQVRDAALVDADLYIRDANPSEDAIQSLDTSSDRWVHGLRGMRVGAAAAGNSWSYESIESYRLGNIVSPVLANLNEINVARPTRLRGERRVYRQGASGPAITQLGALSNAAQPVWSGFTNPADYDGDTRVEIIVRSTDAFNRLTIGTMVFYGRSIIHMQTVAAIHVWDPKKFARLELIAHRLVELGLIDLGVKLPGGGYTPPTPPFDGSAWNRFRADAPLASLVAKRFKDVWRDQETWDRVREVQEEMLRKDPVPQPLTARGDTSTLAAVRGAASSLQRDLDAVVIESFATRGIDLMAHDASITDKLKTLVRSMTPVVRL
jgi:hypothetical protein